MSGARVAITTSGGSYDVLIGDALLGSAGGAIKSAAPGARRAFVVADDALPGRLAGALRQSLAGVGLTSSFAEVRGDERSKTIDGYHGLLARMLDAGLERTDVVVALGGGVIGDLAGFAAATYRRGMRLVQCPTTLLSMVDASIGGKTGVNLEHAGVLRKNMVGAFHQPSLVIADTSALASLSPRLFSSGLAECVKHALISVPFGQPELLGWMEMAARGIVARDAELVQELIERNVRLKSAVVGGDTREESLGADSRALLNLGHTFGHALETMDGVVPTDRDPPITHGEAVALGLVAACRCASSTGELEEGVVSRVVGLLGRLGLPTALRSMPPAVDVWLAMAHDKKSVGGRLHLVLPVRGGRGMVTADVKSEDALAAIESLRA